MLSLKMRFPDVHPVTKLAFLFFASIIALVVPISIQCIVLFAYGILGMLMESRRSFFRRMYLTVLPLACILVIVNACVGISTPSSSLLKGFQGGLSSAFRFLMFVVPFVIIFTGTKPSSFARGFRSTSLPPRISFLFLYSFEIVSDLQTSFHSMIMFQQLRGLSLDGSFFRRWRKIVPLLFPILLSNLARSFDKSVSLYFKGTSRAGIKTYVKEHTIGRIDAALIFLMAVGLLCLLVLSR